MTVDVPGTSLFVLDVEDFRPLADVAGTVPGITVTKQGPYFRVCSEQPFEIDRNATGCRNAVWYSAVAAIRNGRVTRWDRHVLRIEPSTCPTGPAGPHEG